MSLLEDNLIYSLFSDILKVNCPQNLKPPVIPGKKPKRSPN